MAKACEKLAYRAAVDPANIRIVSVRSVEWPDGCLGLSGDELCYVSGPNESISGFEVKFLVGEDHFVYRTDLKDHAQAAD